MHKEHQYLVENTDAKVFWFYDNVAPNTPPVLEK